jgi:Carboxylesterase family
VKGKLPVMVYIPGGAFAFSSGDDFHGDYLMENRDVVCAQYSILTTQYSLFTSDYKIQDTRYKNPTITNNHNQEQQENSLEVECPSYFPIYKR